jgi:hypothetical protein
MLTKVIEMVSPLTENSVKCFQVNRSVLLSVAYPAILVDIYIVLQSYQRNSEIEAYYDFDYLHILSISSFINHIIHCLITQAVDKASLNKTRINHYKNVML